MTASCRACSFLAALTIVGPFESARACAAAAEYGAPVVNADQSVIILWDKETKTEHFIRTASFATTAQELGFIVTTPTKPELDESDTDAFIALADITRPVSRGGGGCAVGCGKAPSPDVAPVRVIEQKTVAGYDVVVLDADSGAALTDWLKKNGFAYTPEAAVWAEPYLKQRWLMTAMKIAKSVEGRAEKKIAASALRLSFKTDRPLFPYREPDSRADAKQLGVSNRLLRLYFLAEARYDGQIEGGAWSGKPVWSGSLDSTQRADVLAKL